MSTFNTRCLWPFSGHPAQVHLYKRGFKVGIPILNGKYVHFKCLMVLNEESLCESVPKNTIQRIISTILIN